MIPWCCVIAGGTTSGLGVQKATSGRSQMRCSCNHVEDPGTRRGRARERNRRRFRGQAGAKTEDKRHRRGGDWPTECQIQMLPRAGGGPGGWSTGADQV